MKRVFGLSFIVLLLIGSSRGQASEDRACKFVEWGFGYVKVEERGELWTYSVGVSGPNWEHSPYGYHAPGALGCESCSSLGLYHFGYFTLHGERKRPATAEERIQRRSEVFGYPYWALGPDGLDHPASREHVVVGPLAGYAVRYSLTSPSAGLPNVGEGKTQSLLVLSLTDGCANFEPTIFAPSADGEDQWALLDSLLQELTIVRRPSSEVPRPTVGAIYMRSGVPWSNWRERTWLHEPNPPKGK